MTLKSSYFPKSIIEGEKAEDLLFSILQKLQYHPRKSTFNENIRNHFDIVYTKGDKTIKIDVKACKRLNRKDTNTNQDIIWIELRNVNGNKGWLYGEADYIVFERENEFVFVDRKELVKLVESLPLEVGETKKEYVILTRKNRKDQIFYMPFSKLQEIKSNYIMPKGLA